MGIIQTLTVTLASVEECCQFLEVFENLELNGGNVRRQTPYTSTNTRSAKRNQPPVEGVDEGYFTRWSRATFQEYQKEAKPETSEDREGLHKRRRTRVSDCGSYGGCCDYRYTRDAVVIEELEYGVVDVSNAGKYYPAYDKDEFVGYGGENMDLKVD